MLHWMLSPGRWDVQRVTFCSTFRVGLWSGCRASSWRCVDTGIAGRSSAFSIMDSLHDCEAVAQTTPVDDDRVMLAAYRTFCGAARRDGHSFSDAARLWKHSSIRKALVEQLTEAMRMQFMTILQSSKQSIDQPARRKESGASLRWTTRSTASFDG